MDMYGASSIQSLALPVSSALGLTTEEIVDKTDHRPEWFLVQCSTQHLGPLPFFLVSKYGE